jgi:hypothetical protein
MNVWQGEQEHLEKTYSNAALSTTDPTWLGPSRRGGMPVTNCLSYDMAISMYNFQ